MPLSSDDVSGSEHFVQSCGEPGQAGPSSSAGWRPGKLAEPYLIEQLMSPLLHLTRSPRFGRPVPTK